MIVKNKIREWTPYNELTLGSGKKEKLRNARLKHLIKIYDKNSKKEEERYLIGKSCI